MINPVESITPTELREPRVRPERGPCVVILTNREYRCFLPDGLDGIRQACGKEPVLLAPESMPPWEDFLRHEQPEVLISAWNMPPLPPIAALKFAPSLKYICYLAGSVRKKVPRCWIDQGLLVTNWGNSISRVVAECALMMILCALRQTAEHQYRMHHLGKWKRMERPERSLFGRRVGLHGFGAIAQSLVRLLKPFDVTIQTYTPYLDAAQARALGVKTCPNLKTLFSSSDILVEVAPLNAETEGLVSRDLLSLLPQGAAFINIGRGKVVREADLIAVAKERQLRVCLDVFEQEPLPLDSPLRQSPEILLMPHQGGPTLDRWQDASNFGLKQLKNYYNAASLEALITSDIWDQAT